MYRGLFVAIFFSFLWLLNLLFYLDMENFYVFASLEVVYSLYFPESMTYKWLLVLLWLVVFHRFQEKWTWFKTASPCSFFRAINQMIISVDFLFLFPLFLIYRCVISRSLFLVSFFLSSSFSLFLFILLLFLAWNLSWLCFLPFFICF